ncbi:MAG: HAD hydrolase family protein [Candidatus Heimdallarchaeota archaeon]|nr:HAD hydrolase family protein [Candidatus Heimdallarchaeota archaeon]
MITFFDLEGPLCPIDHAADVISLIGKKLGKEQDFYKLFQMISLYDDELFLADKKKDYWPGDTLKLIAPIVVSFADEELLFKISREAEPTPGAIELFQYLQQKEIPTYIISTSYTHHAHTISKKLNHPIENVRCTTLDFSLKPDITDALTPLLEDIFPRYLVDGMTEVKEDLDKFFFTDIPKSDFGAVFDSTIVCGGGRKRESVIEILEEHELEASDSIAIGDSITDIQMLEYVRDNGGTGVSFNGNEYSLRPSMIAYSGKSIYPLTELIQAFPKTKEFVSNLSKEEMSKNEEFFDVSLEINEEEFQRILILQKKYRKYLRVKAADFT